MADPGEPSAAVLDEPFAGWAVMCVLTRDPGGSTTGRKTVLRTMVRSLLTLGANVTVVVIGDAERPWLDDPRLRVVHLRSPGLFELAGSVVRGPVLRGTTCNEALYDSPRLDRELQVLTDEVAPDVIIADTVRTTGLVERRNRPWIADLDDLYSARFAALAESDDPEGVLGYYGERLPGPIRRLAERASGLILGTEAGRLEDREIEVARTANATSLVARREARELAHRSGTIVDAVPMAVDAATQSAADTGAPATHAGTFSGVFLGDLAYPPNGVALRWYATEVVPLLAGSGLDDFQLHVIGRHDAALEADVASPHVRFLGYVDDLNESLVAHDVFVAPMQSGTGVSTKILDAFAAAIPVVGTGSALGGIDTESATIALRADSPGEIIDAIRWCRDHPRQAAEIGSAGRRHLRAEYSSEQAVRRWAALLDRVRTTSGIQPSC